ncbi:MAG TPA: DUF2971 domain-containing protein [Verrucomicrobiota bacterium]|jgi:DNA-directed RNA polymerase subunit F|nr:DUF2971 domain-containing protein [Verrucomicrobiota bacterium]
MDSSRKEVFEIKNFPRYLYKYFGLGERTERIITSNEIYFANPTKFNDPFDFKLPIDFNRSIRKLEKEDFVFYLKNLKEDLKNENNEISKEDLPRIKEILNSGDVDSIAEKLLNITPGLKGEIKKIFNNVGVCCFSKEYDNILMWSHYAQAHEGICLKFDRTEDSNFFSQIVNVEYRKRVETDIAKYFLEYYKFSGDTISTKYSDWSYEKEVRVIKTESMDFNCNNRFVKFEPSALKEIIFGVKTKKSTISHYIDLCKNNKNITFSKMRLLKNGRFELKKIPIK